MEINEHLILTDFLADMLGAEYGVLYYQITDHTNGTLIAVRGSFSGEHIPGESLPAYLAQSVTKKEYLHKPYRDYFVHSKSNDQIVRLATHFFQSKGQLTGILCVVKPIQLSPADYSTEQSAPQSLSVQQTQSAWSAAPLQSAQSKELTASAEHLEFVESIQAIQTIQPTQTTAPVVPTRSIQPIPSSVEYDVTEDLYNGPVAELVNSKISAVLSHFESSPARMSPREKALVVERLYTEDVFQIKGAIPEVATALGVSEATIYRRLRIITKSKNDEDTLTYFM